jgi:formylglycine-generating enzyme required for sulfatase activity
MTDSRIDEAIARWLDLNASGVTPDVETFLRDYPDVSGELEGLLRTMRDLGEAGTPLPPTRTIAFGERTLEAVRQLGRGGMGDVYLARESATGAQFAVKVLAPAFASDGERRLRMEREALIGAALDHPNIVRVHGRGDWAGTPCVVMDHVPGIDLADLISRLRMLRDSGQGPIGLREVVRRGLRSKHIELSARQSDVDESATPAGHCRAAARIIAAVADALAHAHDHRVVHRDVKPQNILVDERVVPHVLDFGLARGTDDLRISRTGDQVGTVHYMSPEMVHEGSSLVDHRTDVYSLGVTLFELLTLTLPFVGNSSPVVLRRISHDPVPRPRSRNPAIPEPLQAIVLTALRKNPARRYATAAAMRDDLERFLAGRPVEATTPGALERGFDLVRRGRRALAIGGGVLLASAAVTAMAFGHGADRGIGIEVAGVDGTFTLQQLDRGALVARRTVRAPTSPLRTSVEPGTWLLTVRKDGGVVADIALAVGLLGAGVRGAANVDRTAFRVARPASHEHMVLIPAGTWSVGVETTHGNDALLRQQVTLPAFYIDECEVSVREYAAFCAATRHPTPRDWPSGVPSPEQEALPATRMSWHDACDYATWCGKRLPLDVEWEVAARGPDGSWGQQVARLDVNLSARGGESPAPPVWPCTVAHDDVNPWGIKNMAGNAREWVLDLWSPRAGEFPPGFPGGARILRGGGTNDRKAASVVTHRVPMLPELSTYPVGFRCALTAQ